MQPRNDRSPTRRIAQPHTRMRTKIASGTPAEKASAVAKPTALEIPHDPANEAAVISAALSNPDLLKSLVRKVLPDHFLSREHRDVWGALGSMMRAGIEVDPAALRTSAGERVATLCEQLRSIAPAKSIEWHVGNLLWDAARATAAKGPVPAFLQLLQDPRADRDRIVSLSRQITNAFQGYEDRRYRLDPIALVRDQMKKVEERAFGRADYPTGIPGLDRFENGRRRITVGLRPGNITVLTSTTGGGKSTTAARMTLGIAFPGGTIGGTPWGSEYEPNALRTDMPGRKVAYGSWEMQGGTTLELLAAMSLGWSRSEMSDPVDGENGGFPSPIRTDYGRRILQERMALIGTRVHFLANPFGKQVGERKGGNDRNLDILQGYLSDMGCEVFFADLWKKCLAQADPESEEMALNRTQTMADELMMHFVLLQQQKSKELEQRTDKRPSRDLIKGSGAWSEIADLILGAHRPGLWKKIVDNVLQLSILKQREGKWPLAVECDWDAEYGSITGGMSIDYDQIGEGNEMDQGIVANWMNNRGPKNGHAGLPR